MPEPDGVYHTPQGGAWGTLTSSALAGCIAMNAVSGLIIVSHLAFFEEMRWRAFMLPRLVNRFGARRAAAASTLTWALLAQQYDVDVRAEAESERQRSEVRKRN